MPSPSGRLPQQLESREFEVAGLRLALLQDPKASRALRPLAGEGAEAGSSGEEIVPAGKAGGALEGVGLVAWQCGFLLADYLLRRPPFGAWQDVRVVDLGTGTGVVGIALALAGADVVLTDLPHVTHLTRHNVQANCDPSRHRATVVDYAWAAPDLPPELLTPPADLITGADLVYDPGAYKDLLAALAALAAPHTLVLLAVKARGKGEEGFLSDLADAGFAVLEVPASQLGEDYREEGDTYRLFRACKLG